MQRRICRLCLKTCQNFQAIVGRTKADVLDRMALNLAVSKEPVMCTNCAETLQNSFDFKTMCVDTHHYIVSFSNNKENAKVDLDEVYLNKQENGFGIPEDHVVCRFCMGLVKSCSAISLDSEIGDVMMEKCLPELDLSVFNTPIVCTSCQESLDKCFCFVQDCLIVEKKIQKYCESGGIDSVGCVELTDVQEYVSRNMLKSEEGNTLGIRKEEIIFCKEEQYADKEFDYKDESLMAVKAPILNSVQQFSSNNTSICKAEDSKAGIINIAPIYVVKDEEIEHKYENFVVLEDQKLLFNEDERLTEVQDQKFYDVQHFTPELEDKKFLTTDDIEIKTDPNYSYRYQDKDALIQPKASIELLPGRQVKMVANMTESCSCQKNCKVDVDAHTQTGPKIYKCLSCPQQMRCKHELQKHIKLTHKSAKEITMHQCDVCSFEAKYISGLHRHMLTHKDSSEITMHQCDFCSFQTKHKQNLRMHTLVHKDPSEITMHQCDSCSYQTRYNRVLQRHMLTHKSSLESPMHQCESCSFKTKYKQSLLMHMLTHRDPSEIKMYQCETCTFKTKHKRSLSGHMLIHKDHSEIKIHRCDFCSYETKYSSGIREHMLIHKASPGLNMYQCQSCSFKTKHKRSLRGHMLTHKDPSEVKTYRCDLCSYQTKYGRSIQRHKLIHKSCVELTMYRCESCSYQTKHKNDIRKHVVTHMHPSETTMYQCESCSFETKYKTIMRGHVKTHKKSSDVRLVRFEKNINNVKTHMLNHKSPSELTE